MLFSSLVRRDLSAWIGRPSLRRGLALLGLMLCAASPAGAQGLTFQFQNPSFGGNPFYSDHLMAVATAQRPPQPRAETTTLTPTQLFARQLESRLLAGLSSGLIQAITGSDPGTTGEFQLGDQRVRFERTLTEIRVTIFNDLTGEITEIVVPVLNFTPGNSNNPGTVISAGADPGVLAAGLVQQPLEAGTVELPVGGLGDEP